MKVLRESLLVDEDTGSAVVRHSSWATGLHILVVVEGLVADTARTFVEQPAVIAEYLTAKALMQGAHLRVLESSDETTILQTSVKQMACISFSVFKAVDLWSDGTGTLLEVVNRPSPF
jgi:hypothetical protein